MSIMLPNEVQLQKTLVGINAPANPAAPVAPTFKLYGAMAINRHQPLADYTEFDGSLDADIIPVRGAVTVDGTYAQNLTYEDWPILLRLGVRGQVAGVSDGNATPGYAYDYIGSSARLDLATVEQGFPGMPFKSELLHFPEFTVSADIDDAEACWKWASNIWARTKDRIVGAAPQNATSATANTLTKTAAGWTINAFQGAWVVIRTGLGAGQWREILSNTATVLTVADNWVTTPDATSVFEISGNFTAGVPDRTREKIDAPGTKLYIDDATIHTTQQFGKLISFSATHQNNTIGKRFMENVNSLSTKIGRGKRRITGMVRMEFDDWQEYDKWVASTKRLVSIEQTGSVINVAPETRKLARIDLPNLQWDDVTPDERESNLTRTFAFRGYKDAAAGYVAKYLGKIPLATLP